MKLYKNYKRDGFYQILPLLFVKDRRQWIVLLGFGTKNIAFIFGKNMKPKPTTSKVSAPLLPYIKGESTSTKRWKAKVDKINNTIRVEEEEEPVTSATKVVISDNTKKAIMIGIGALAVVALGYYFIKKSKK